MYIQMTLLPYLHNATEATRLQKCDDGITDVMISTDVYLLSSGELVEGETINVKSGDFDMEYKSQIRYIESPYDFAFDEDYLFESLDAIAEEKDPESEVA